jgi:hypothetical protein
MPVNCARVMLQFRSCCGNAVSRSPTRSVLAALPRRGPLQFDGCFVGPILRFLAFAIQLVAALGQRVLAGLPSSAISAADC